VGKGKVSKYCYSCPSGTWV